MTDLSTQRLPRAAPARVLACGAFLKNTACLLEGTEVRWSPLHDDLSTPQACRALDASLKALVASANGPIAAVAHDLHPDFHSTRLALQWAAELGVPALAVQHHHAHIGVVQAEQGWGPEPLVGLALDGVGLGNDGHAWGGEVLVLRGPAFDRVAHLPWLALPGGDVAAREPWRLAAAVLHGSGRGDEIVARFGHAVSPTLARGVHTMLQRGLNCPLSSGAGRWFDAAAGASGLSVRQGQEAEAAQALERAATQWWAARGAMQCAGGPDGAPCAEPRTPGAALSLEAKAGAAGLRPMPGLADLPAIVASLFDEADAGRGAARFHLALSQALVAAAIGAARRAGSTAVALGGGCLFNRLLSAGLEAGLTTAGLRVARPQGVSPGDAGLALGQAWVAALSVSA